jgi:hypothetical protein
MRNRFCATDVPSVFLNFDMVPFFLSLADSIRKRVEEGVLPLVDEVYAINRKIQMLFDNG